MKKHLLCLSALLLFAFTALQAQTNPVPHRNAAPVAVSNTEPAMETIIIRLNPYTVNWDNVYLYVWTGNSSYSDNTPSMIVVAAQQMTLAEDGWWTYSFEYESGYFYVGFASQQSSSPSYYNSSTTYSGSTCFEINYNRSLKQTAYRRLETETITIRLNPYSVNWDNAYLYVWTGNSYYNNSNSTKLVAAQQMTIAEDGWWTYSFEYEKETYFYISFSSSNSSNFSFDGYSDSEDNSAVVRTASGSTCFEYNGLGLKKVEYRKLTTETITIRLNPYTMNWDNAYLCVWRGNSNYSSTSSEYILIAAKEMILAEDGWWTYSFEYEVGTLFNIGFDYQSDNSPYYYRYTSYTDSSNAYSGSTCFEYNGGGLKKVEYRKLEAENVTIRLNPYTVNWDNAYLYVWTGYSSYSNSNSTKLVAAQQMTIAEDGWWTYSFEYEKGVSYYAGFASQQSSSPSYYNSSTTYSGSTCFGMNNGSLQQVEYRKLEAENVTIRLNPYTVNWDNAYLYVWTGYSSYSNSNSTKLVAAQQMTIAEDGWWTYSFETKNGTSFYVGFDYQSDSSPYYYNSSTTYSGSTCFEINNNSNLQTTAYKKLTPDESSTFAVHVATAGTFGQAMAQVLGNYTWVDVAALTLTGSLNEDDMTYFARMINLQHLDMSDTDIKIIVGCKDLVKLNRVVLPTTCTTISDNAFYGCTRLKSINLDYVQSIGTYAFYQCRALSEVYMPKLLSVGKYAFAYSESSSSYNTTSLTSVTMPVVQTIGNYAFCGNARLASVTMPLVISIGQYAFANCYALAQADIANATSLGKYAFYMYSTSTYTSELTNVILSKELKQIPAYCFYNCPKLISLVYPAALTTIGNNALPYVTDVQLPSNVTSVGSGNFTNATAIKIPSKVTSWQSFSKSWQHVYCHVVVPPVFSVFNTDNVREDTLHVPAISLEAYKYSDSWYKFGKVVTMDSSIDDLTFNSSFTILTTEGIANKADITINAGGALTLSADNAMTAGSYVQQIDTKKAYSYSSYYDENNNYQYYYYSYMPYTGMLLANSAISADEVSVRLVPAANKWNFFSLPFDVNMTDITIGTEGTGTVGTSQWVIREYSGANRASGNGATWNNVPADGVLKANTGYILYWVVEGGGSTNDDFYYYFNMPAVKNANMQKIFATGDVCVPLTEYSAEFPQNRSWNLVGNPYPCAFDIRQMDFEAPITTWNGSGYTAYSPLDDNYMLRPAEGFFVQAPQGTTGITFRKEGRSVVNTNEVTYEEYNNNRYYAPARRVATHNPARKVFNFTLSNADYTDRARLVLNEQASADYELTRDAAKMLSQDKTVPQLYVNDNGIHYAIDECPEQSIYVLGAFFGKAGEYTLRLNVPQNEDRRIILTDTETGVATELTNGDYTFTTDAGTFDSRFVISLAPRVATDMDEKQALTVPTKTMENGTLIITTPQGKKYTAGGTEL